MYMLRALRANLRRPCRGRLGSGDKAPAPPAQVRVSVSRAVRLRLPSASDDGGIIYIYIYIYIYISVDRWMGTRRPPPKPPRIRHPSAPSPPGQAAAATGRTGHGRTRDIAGRGVFAAVPPGRTRPRISELRGDVGGVGGVGGGVGGVGAAAPGRISPTSAAACPRGRAGSCSGEKGGGVNESNVCACV